MDCHISDHNEWTMMMEEPMMEKNDNTVSRILQPNHNHNHYHHNDDTDEETSDAVVLLEKSPSNNTANLSDLEKGDNNGRQKEQPRQTHIGNNKNNTPRSSRSTTITITLFLWGIPVVIVNIMTIFLLTSFPVPVVGIVVILVFNVLLIWEQLQKPPESSSGNHHPKKPNKQKSNESFQSPNPSSSKHSKCETQALLL